VPPPPPPGDATPPSLSPAALKLLRKIRRRLEAAQEAAAPPPTAAAAAADVFNSSGSFRRQHSSSRRRGQGAGGGGPLRPLLLVGPGWVADSVTDLQQQLQRHSSWQLTQQLLLSQQQQGVGSFTQQQSQQGVFQSFDSQASLDLLRTELRQQRRSEVLYMVKAVLPPQQQQQQQQQGEGQQLLTAAAAGDGAVGGEEGGVMGSGVMGWPWGSVGLKARDGAASSGESSDGGYACTLDQQQQQHYRSLLALCPALIQWSNMQALPLCNSMKHVLSCSNRTSCTMCNAKTCLTVLRRDVLCRALQVVHQRRRPP